MRRAREDHAKNAYAGLVDSHLQPAWISDKSPAILLQVGLGDASDSRSLVGAVLT